MRWPTVCRLASMVGRSDGLQRSLDAVTRLESECWKLLEFMSQSDPDCDEYLILWGQHQAYLEVLHELEGVQQKRLVAERKDWTL